MALDAGDKLPAASAQAEAIAAIRDLHSPSSATDEDLDDLYGDVNVGFLPLPPDSPTSPPKTPSPGSSIPSPSPPSRRGRLPNPQPEQEPEAEPERPKPTARRQAPLPAAKPTPRRQAPQHATGDGTSPPTTAIFISELYWWTTDAEVEGALAPHGALHGVHFYSDKFRGKSLGICRADFLHADAAASAAAALNGRAFHGRQCVASLQSPPALLRLGEDDPHAQAPSAIRVRGRGRNGSKSTTAWGNVGPPHGDPLPLPLAPRLPQLPFGGMMGGGGGYGGFAPLGPCHADMGAGMLAPHVNPEFLAAGGMAMRGTGAWYDHRMAGGLWGGHHPWGFGGYEMPPWQQIPPAHGHHHQTRQLNRNGDYGEERRRHPPPRVMEQQRQWDEKDRYGGDKRRHQEDHAGRDSMRRVPTRSRSRSLSRDGDEDDHPRWRR
ncbi:hypothetical protein ABZP36_008245 [Zizania latifolia]